MFRNTARCIDAICVIAGALIAHEIRFSVPFSGLAGRLHIQPCSPSPSRHLRRRLSRTWVAAEKWCLFVIWHTVTRNSSC
jgi:hypothetical protein